MSFYDFDVQALDGSSADLHDHEGKALLVVNVASKCGLTPQYTALEGLQKTYADRGFSVLGFPCNQFMGQEPGTSEEIAEFCSATYGVTFPMFSKIEVNGDGRDPLYAELTTHPDGEGATSPPRATPTRTTPSTRRAAGRRPAPAGRPHCGSRRPGGCARSSPTPPRSSVRSRRS